MRSIGTGAITLAGSLLACGSRLSNSVAVAKNLWFVIAFDRETAALIRQSNRAEDDARADDAIS